MEPKTVRLLLNDKECAREQLTSGAIYPTKQQFREPGDDSKIVYLKSPKDPEGERLVALTETEYEVIS